MNNDFTVLGIKHGKPIEQRYIGFSLEFVINSLKTNSPEIKNIVIMDSDRIVVYMSKDEQHRKTLFNAVCALNELKAIPFTDYKYFDRDYIEELKNVCEYVYKGLTLYT